MKNFRTHLIRYGALALLLLACCAFTQQKDRPKEPKEKEEDNKEVAVIVNPANSVDAISLADLRKIFAGERQSWGSRPISLFVRGPGARERDVLLSLVLKMNESEYQQYWVKKVYSGEAPRQPLALLSNGMQLEAIRAEKGAIALISFRDVHPGVKVLKVEGRSPGMNGYPLK